jgi:hypothetical protein
MTRRPLDGSVTDVESPAEQPGGPSLRPRSLNPFPAAHRPRAWPDQRSPIPAQLGGARASRLAVRPRCLRIASTASVCGRGTAHGLPRRAPTPCGSGSARTARMRRGNRSGSTQERRLDLPVECGDRRSIVETRHPGCQVGTAVASQAAGGSPNRSATRTSSATDRTPILRIRRPRWTLMFCSPVPRSAAIFLFSFPAMTWPRTSRSRGVSRASRSCSAASSSLSACCSVARYG